MRRPGFGITLLLAFPLGCPSDADAQAAVPPIVDVAWLADHIDDPNVVLLHVDNRDGFARGHIPGAYLAQQSDFAAPHDMSRHDEELALELPHPDTLRRRLEALGVSDDSHIVVYWGRDWVSPTTRVIFTLDWLGLGTRVSLLDGGMPAWVAAGHATTAEPSAAARPGRLTARAVRRDAVVDAGWVNAHAGADGFAIVDARDVEFYQGTSNESRGHVPSAVSIPYTSLVDEDLRVRDRATLTALFRDAGIEADDVIAVYCHIGQQGTAIVFAARLTGHRVHLYDGSFQDWQRRGLPIDIPSGAAGR